MGIKSISKGNRILIVSFVATFIVLSAAALAIIYLPRLQTLQHIPSTYSVVTPNWMRFVAKGPDKITVMNFTNIHTVNGDFSVFTSEELLVLSGFSKVNVTNSQYLVTASYANPNPNSDELTLNVIKTNSATYAELQGELPIMSSAAYSYGQNIIYQVTRFTSDSPAYVNGYACLRDGYLLYSDGISGMDLIKTALDNEAGTTRLIDESEVKASLYLLSQGKGVELAYSYSKFPYAVTDVVATATIVRYDSNTLITSSVYVFNTTSAAQRDIDKIKQANLNATDFQIIDNYILVTAKYDKANLLGELRSI
jgi:hypothetical protein